MFLLHISLEIVEQETDKEESLNCEVGKQKLNQHLEFSLNQLTVFIRSSARCKPPTLVIRLEPIK